MVPGCCGGALSVAVVSGVGDVFVMIIAADDAA